MYESIHVKSLICEYKFRMKVVDFFRTFFSLQIFASILKSKDIIKEIYEIIYH